MAEITGCDPPLAARQRPRSRQSHCWRIYENRQRSNRTWTRAMLTWIGSPRQIAWLSILRSR
jgi:hypothetical protein